MEYHGEDQVALMQHLVVLEVVQECARHIVEIEGGTATRFKGNYSAFAQQKDAGLLAQARAFKDQQEYLAKEMEFIRRNMAAA